MSYSTAVPPKRQLFGRFAWLWILVLAVAALAIAFLLSAITAVLMIGGVVAFGILLFVLYRRLTIKRTS